MKKIFPIFLVSISILLVFTAYFQTTSAYFGYGGSSSGGRIISTKAVEIKKWEDAGYTCAVPGKTITIKPFGSFPRSYLIPYSVTSKTRMPLTNNSLILNLYSKTTTPIKCTEECAIGECDVEIVNLPSISLFGNSR